MNNTPTYTVKVNELQFDFDSNVVNDIDIVKKTDTEYHILDNHISYTVKIISTELNDKKQTIEVNGEVYTVNIKDPLDLILEKMGFSSVSNKRLKELKAPMPGLVLDIAVKEGQQVAKGDKILILEAMKMENSISIPNDGVIKSVLVKAGQSVEKGQLMIELE